MKVSVGIMAYNEEQNIGELLTDLLSQNIAKEILDEVIIISSGSTDATNQIITKFAKKDKRIKPIFQKTRKGKAAAVNLFLEKSRNDILVLLSADILLKSTTFRELLKPLKHSGVGIVGAHPVPVNDKTTFFGFTAHTLWDLHHKISLKSPKMGEMIAFRKIFKRIPQSTSVDEANIEPLIKGQGYKAIYAPKAVVYNKGPETLSEFIHRRRHIAAGHYSVRYDFHYSVSTLSGLKVFKVMLTNLSPSWRFIFWMPLIVLLEMYCRMLGFLDYTFHLCDHTVWHTTPSTKNLKALKLNA